jgi:hypothetical protein
LLSQGFAEIVQRRPDLIPEGLGAALRGIEEFLAGGVQQARYVDLERLKIRLSIRRFETSVRLCSDPD